MITSRMMIAIGREKKYGMSPPFGAAMIKVLRKLDSRISETTTPRTRGAGSNQKIFIRYPMRPNTSMMITSYMLLLSA